MSMVRRKLVNFTGNHGISSPNRLNLVQMSFSPAIKYEHAGPWSVEPDYASWTNKKTGTKCEIIRDTYLGFWCGYADTHLYQDTNLTYSHGDLVALGDYRIGFDCGHIGDLLPMNPGIRHIYIIGVYRDVRYVANWTDKLATQIFQKFFNDFPSIHSGTYK